ncbi:MAG: PA14 domain-containing protein, partial [Alphaproteobacteria bacterium]
HLEQAGAYEFMLLSNDGVRLEIGRQLVFEDPLIHSDTWSPALMVTAAEGGWHDFWLAYYQKKGTSALQLTWKRPGDTEFTVVPPVAFGHLASAE